MSGFDPRPDTDEEKDSLACWACNNCKWTSQSPNLDGPIMHETVTGHKTRPTVNAASAWAPVLGKIDAKRKRDGIKW